MDTRNDKYRTLRVLLAGSFKTDGKELDAVGRTIGISGQTVRKYLGNPEKAPLEKLLRLGRSLNIPIDAIRDAIKY